MIRRLQNSPLYSDFRDLALLVLATDCIAALVFGAMWKILTMHWHR